MTLKSLVGPQHWFVQVLFQLPSPQLTRELNAVFWVVNGSTS